METLVERMKKTVYSASQAKNVTLVVHECVRSHSKGYQDFIVTVGLTPIVRLELPQTEDDLIVIKYFIGRDKAVAKILAKILEEQDLQTFVKNVSIHNLVFGAE